MPDGHHHDAELARWDFDHDGEITDHDLAQAPVPPRWRRLGLHGPAIVLRWFTRNAKRLAVLVAGGAVLLAGVAMLVLPGPGVLVLLVGLMILATEFAWAERALDRTASRASQAMVAVSGNAAGRGLLLASGVGLVGVGVVGMFALPDVRIAAVSLALAGLIALATLTPPAQRWLHREHSRRSGST